MITVIICSAYPGIPKAQLYWLSRQSCQDFELLLLDGYSDERRCLSDYAETLGFGSRFKHLPLLEQQNVAKRFDYTPRNNACLLATYNRILMLDDNEYYRPDMIETVVASPHPYHYFFVNELSPTAFNPVDYSVDLKKAYAPVQTSPDGLTGAPHIDAPDDVIDPTIVWNHDSFERESLIYQLNGFDEAATAAYAWDDNEIGLRRDKTGIKFIRHFKILFHMDHVKSVRKLKTLPPCCIDLNLDAADPNCVNYRQLFGESNPKVIYYDEHGYDWFRCGACGFSGPVDGQEFLEQTETDERVKASIGWNDRRLGRNLACLYEDLKGRSWNDKLALIEDSFYCSRYYSE